MIRRSILVVIGISLLLCLPGCSEHGRQLERLFPAGPAREMAAAAGKGDSRRIDQLIHEGVAVDVPGKEGVTPLWWAMRVRNKEGFRHLLERGADPNARLSVADCIMDVAAGEKDPEFLRLALAHGADPNLANGDWQAPPIFYAVRKFNLASIRILIASGADLNVRNDGGQTPLVLAAVFARYEYVFVMLRAGADPTVSSPNGRVSLVNEIAGRHIDPNHDAYIWREKVIIFLREKHGIEATKPVNEGVRTKPMPADLAGWPER